MGDVPPPQGGAERDARGQRKSDELQIQATPEMQGPPKSDMGGTGQRGTGPPVHAEDVEEEGAV